MWKKVVGYRPEEPRSYYGLADSYRRNNQLALAVGVYKQMLERSWESRFGNVGSQAKSCPRSIESEMKN